MKMRIFAIAAAIIIITGPCDASSRKQRQSRKPSGSTVMGKVIVSQEAVNQVENILSDVKKNFFVQCNGKYYVKLVQAYSGKTLAYEEYETRPEFFHSYDRYISKIDSLNGLQYSGRIGVMISGIVRQTINPTQWGEYKEIKLTQVFAAGGDPRKWTLMELKKKNGLWSYENLMNGRYMAPRCEEVAGKNPMPKGIDNSAFQAIGGTWEIVLTEDGEPKDATLVVAGGNATIYESDFKTQLSMLPPKDYTISMTLSSVHLEGGAFDFYFRPIGGEAFILLRNVGQGRNFEQVSIKSHSREIKTPTRSPNSRPKTREEMLTPELQKLVNSFIETTFTRCNGRLYTAEVETMGPVNKIQLYEVDGLKWKIGEEAQLRSVPRPPGIVYWSPSVLLSASSAEQIFSNSSLRASQGRIRKAESFITLQYFYGEDQDRKQRWFGPYPDVNRMTGGLDPQRRANSVRGNLCAPSCSTVASPEAALKMGRQTTGLSCPSSR